MSAKTRTAIVLLIVIGALAALAVVFVTSSQRQAQQAASSAPPPLPASNLQGEAFLAQNATAPGVQTTASGLQYRVDRAGAGGSPTLASQVTVHYRGSLLNGTVFDSSYDRGQPATFPLSGVIQGWQEGLQLMQAGAQYTFWIPPDLGYGARGVPGTIPPDSVLVFQVELLSFE